MATEDIELVREYAAHQSEQAFETLVSRYVNLVYSTALRQVRDPHFAEEITQAVFIILARKAGSLNASTILPAWLYRAACYASADALKTQRRRQRREQEARMQSELQGSTPDPIWELISPHLDEALMWLSEPDRRAVVLHFFEKRTFAEVGNLLGTSEDTARKRANRALERLRDYLSRRGIVSTAAIIGEAISVNSVQTVPAALAKSVTAVATAKGAAASVSTLTLIKGALRIMAWTNTKTAIVAGAVLLLAAGTTTTIVTVENNRARKMEKLWRINKDLSPAQVNRLPPMIRIIPTKFVNSPWVNWNAGNNGKFVGANAPPRVIASCAYGVPSARIRFSAEEPTNRFDFIATLPQGSRETLQRELEARLGFVGRRKTETMDVLLLNVSHANAPGLRPPIPGKSDAYMKDGAFHTSDAPLGLGDGFQGLAYYLEGYFKLPVIDQTGITQHFSMDLRWREDKYRGNPEGLKQALLDKLGLELTPANIPVEVLVMEKAP